MDRCPQCEGRGRGRGRGGRREGGRERTLTLASYQLELEYKQKLTAKTRKLLEENRRETVHKHNSGKHFLEKTRKEQTIKEETDENRTSSKRKTSPLPKSPSRRDGTDTHAEPAPPAGERPGLSWSTAGDTDAWGIKDARTGLWCRARLHACRHSLIHILTADELYSMGITLRLN